MIIEGIFISKTVTSLQIKVHECYVKPLKPRESLLTIEEEEEEEESEGEYAKDGIEDLVISVEDENEWGNTYIFNTNFVLKINQILRTHPWVKFIRISTPFH